MSPLVPLAIPVALSFGAAGGCAPNGERNGRADCPTTAPEVCDGVDNDCDAEVDESDAVDAGTWYADEDRDGFGGGEDLVVCCTAPAGWTSVAGDCDDTDPTVNPGAEERCNGLDDDCDGDADEPGSVGGETWFMDTDGDGYGDPASPIAACEQPPDAVADASDCDDGDREVHPGASETCATTWDDDCDGVTNPSGADGCADFYRDEDGDGFGTDEERCLCVGDAPFTAAVGGDCDDADSAKNPDGKSCRLAGDVSLGDAAAILTGEEEGDEAGWAVAAGGDLDGDGVLDLLVSGPAVSGWTGAAYVVHGPVSGTRSLADAHAKVLGEASDVSFGVSVAGVGDLDGDGLDDMLVGEQGVDGSVYPNEGAAFVVLGPVTGTVSVTDVGLAIRNPGHYGDLGSGVTLAGDSNGDGIPEVLVGAQWDNSGGMQNGSAYLLPGPFTGDVDVASAQATFIGEAEKDRVGFRFDGNADVNGDGLPDVAIGAENDDVAGSSAGAAYIVYGPLTGTIDLGTADAKLVGEAAGDSAGSDTALATDTDGDGFADVLVGAYMSDDGGFDAGSAYLVTGPISGEVSLADATARLVGEDKFGWTGWALDGRGDFDQDGFSDVVVGAPFLAKAYLLYGPLSGTIALADADARFLPTSTSDMAGYSVAFVGDLTGDGDDDVVIGAALDHLGAGWAGAVYLFDGVR